MIAGRVRNYATITGFLTQAHDSIGRPASLKRTDLLEVLTLEKHLSAEFGVEGRRSENRGSVQVRRDPGDRR
jgi:hypothetical protein